MIPASHYTNLKSGDKLILTNMWKEPLKHFEINDEFIVISHYISEINLKQVKSGKPFRFTHDIVSKYFDTIETLRNNKIERILNKIY